ncbi:hypothetical protein [Vibrio nereis]|uniref:hypothetical protein n=1 Tax=Vibrio nereis TaxID=693 RepID=UPI002494B903|nr:hypothetical protein [Vibrio nereis]
MNDSLISKICNSQNKNRDLLVDELNDEIESESFSADEILLIIHKLLILLPVETDQAVHESILNLLSGVYPSGNGAKDIEKYVLNYIQELNPGSLVHALSILSESNLVEKKEIFTNFTHSDNEAIRKIAQSLLTEV